MTKSQCRSEIKRNEALIQAYETKIKELEKHIAELGQTKNRMGELRNKFISCKSVSGARLEQIERVRKFQVRITTGFYQGMHGLLTGTAYTKTLAGLNGGTTTIEFEIVKKKNEINDYRRNIAVCQQRILKMRAEIARIEEAERRAERARRAAEALQAAAQAAANNRQV